MRFVPDIMPVAHLAVAGNSRMVLLADISVDLRVLVHVVGMVVTLTMVDTNFGWFWKDHFFERGESMCATLEILVSCEMMRLNSLVLLLCRCDKRCFTCLSVT